MNNIQQQVISIVKTANDLTLSDTEKQEKVTEQTYALLRDNERITIKQAIIEQTLESNGHYLTVAASFTINGNVLLGEPVLGTISRIQLGNKISILANKKHGLDFTKSTMDLPASYPRAWLMSELVKIFKEMV